MVRARVDHLRRGEEASHSRRDLEKPHGERPGEARIIMEKM